MCFAFEMKNILWMGRYSYSCNVRDNTNKNQRNKEGREGGEFQGQTLVVREVEGRLVSFMAEQH